MGILFLWIKMKILYLKMEIREKFPGLSDESYSKFIIYEGEICLKTHEDNAFILLEDPFVNKRLFIVDTDYNRDVLFQLLKMKHFNSIYITSDTTKQFFDLIKDLFIENVVLHYTPEFKPKFGENIFHKIRCNSISINAQTSGMLNLFDCNIIRGNIENIRNIDCSSYILINKEESYNVEEIGFIKNRILVFQSIPNKTFLKFKFRIIALPDSPVYLNDERLHISDIDKYSYDEILLISQQNYKRIESFTKSSRKIV